MPHFHLHVHNHHGDALDEEGGYFDDLAAARQSAIRGIRSFLSAEVMEGAIDLRGHLDIADDAGRVFARVEFYEAVTVRTH